MRIFNIFSENHETNEEIELKVLENSHSSRVKRNVQNYHRLSPHEQQLQRHHQRQLQHQYEAHQREARDRELRERQRLSQYRASTSTISPYRDARRYQQMQQPPQQQYNHNMYNYRHDFPNAMQSSQHQKSDETKEYTIEVLVAVDKKMQEYHGKNLKNYVLTLMSVVSGKISMHFLDV